MTEVTYATLSVLCMELPHFQHSEALSCAGVQGLSAYLASEKYVVLTSAGNHDGPSERALYWRNVVAGTSKADSTRALKTRRLKRQTKRVVTPTEFSNEELCKNSRSNLDERF